MARLCELVEYDHKAGPNDPDACMYLTVLLIQSNLRSPLAVHVTPTWRFWLGQVQEDWRR